MKKWLVVGDGGEILATVSASIGDVEDELGPEGKRWYRKRTPRGFLLIVRQK